MFRNECSQLLGISQPVFLILPGFQLYIRPLKHQVLSFLPVSDQSRTLQGCRKQKPRKRFRKSHWTMPQ